MNADEARRLTELKLKENNEFKKYVKYTENDIIEAIKRGERKCVLTKTNRLLPSLVKHFENLGYTVKTNVPPYTESYYLFW